MRRLIIIPIVHAASDLGRLQGNIAEAKVKLMSESTIESGRRMVELFWSELKEAITCWSQDFSKMQIYQDALPIGPNQLLNIEQKIIDDLSAKGSENHRLLQWLSSRGAKIFGTEDPGLLLREYQLAQRSLKFYDSDRTASQSDFDQHCEEQRMLLESRDAFIVQRIEKTLLADHSGLIFLGMLHRLEPHLSSDIEVTYPFGKPALDHVRTA